MLNCVKPIRNIKLYRLANVETYNKTDSHDANDCDLLELLFWQP